MSLRPVFNEFDFQFGMQCISNATKGIHRMPIVVSIFNPADLRWLSSNLRGKLCLR